MISKTKKPFYNKENKKARGHFNRITKASDFEKKTQPNLSTGSRLIATAA